MGQIDNIQETELARCARKQGDPRVLSRATGKSDDGKTITWYSLEAGRVRVTLRASELATIGQAMIDAAKGAAPAHTPAGPPPQQRAARQEPQRSSGPSNGRKFDGPGKPFHARYRSTCSRCRGVIEAGEQARMNSGQAEHIECPRGTVAHPPTPPREEGPPDDDFMRDEDTF